MELTINSYPKCKCGGTLVPVYYKKVHKEAPHDTETELLEWRCESCEKRIER